MRASASWEERVGVVKGTVTKHQEVDIVTANQ